MGNIITSFCIFLRIYLLKILWRRMSPNPLVWSVFGDLPFLSVRTPSNATSLHNSSHHTQRHSIIVERKDRQERKRNKPVFMVLFIAQDNAKLPIECFHSLGQHLCKFIRTKKVVCRRKEFKSHRTGLGHQHGRRFIV